MKNPNLCVRTLSLVVVTFVGCSDSDADRDLAGGSDTTATMIVDGKDADDGDNSGAATERILTPEEAQEIVRKGVMDFDVGMRSDDESVRQATFDRFMPTKDDLAILFGESDAQKIWIRLEPGLVRMRQQTDLLKQEVERQGELLEVEVIDVREDHDLTLFKQVLKVIPKTIPIYRIVKRFKEGSSGSSSYVVIGGKMVFVRGLEGMYEFLQSPEAE